MGKRKNTKHPAFTLLRCLTLYIAERPEQITFYCKVNYATVWSYATAFKKTQPEHQTGENEAYSTDGPDARTFQSARLQKSARSFCSL